MMGWLLFVGLAVLAVALLLLLRFPRRLWTIPATALALGAAGYTWQGSPGLAGTPVNEAKRAGEIDPGLVALREAMFGRFNTSYAFYAQADAMTRLGALDTAARAMLNGTRQAPGDVGVWTGLGLSLADAGGGVVSPASRFAFDRAMAIRPDHPGPPFFLGLAYVRAGEFAKARPLWAEAVELAPADASYRPELIARLTLLDAFLATEAAQPAP